MKHAAIGPISLHFPARVETNDELAAAYPKWDMERIFEKTGIRQRYVAEPDECASTWPSPPRRSFFTSTESIAARSITCSSARRRPITSLPTTACLLQHRLKLPNTTGRSISTSAAPGSCMGSRWSAGPDRVGPGGAAFCWSRPKPIPNTLTTKTVRSGRFFPTPRPRR